MSRRAPDDLSRLFDAVAADPTGWELFALIRSIEAARPDAPPLGSALANTYSIPFQGSHHAVHQYTVNYPRWGVAGGVDVKYDMPVTVQWFFRTGSDAPVWSVVCFVVRAGYRRKGLAGQGRRV